MVRIGRRKRRNKHRVMRRNVVVSVADSFGDHHSASRRGLNSSGQKLDVSSTTEHEDNQITFRMRVRTGRSRSNKSQSHSLRIHVNPRAWLARKEAIAIRNETMTGQQTVQLVKPCYGKFPQR